MYLEEKDFGNPKIEYGMFSKADQKKLNKYFKPIEQAKPQEDASVVSSISNSTPKYHYEYKAGKKHRVLNQNLQNDILHEAGEARKRRRVTSDLKKAKKSLKGNYHISDELANFLNKPKRSVMTKIEVTREIRDYIRKNNLQDPTEEREYTPDAKLKKLFTLSQQDKLKNPRWAEYRFNVFNLPTFLSRHFLQS